FIDAFNTHEVKPMLAITSPDVKWEDVSGHIEFEGRDGVKNMVELTLMAVPDCKFTYHGGMKNGNDYVVEWTMSGTAFGTEFACRGASVGETDDDGKILHNRDYWDSRSFPEMPAGPVNPELEDLQAKHA
ncbi:MAG TPA: nuclear transport factor 2 family protein, partial [Mycobacterium sp.]|nr:nuclear transport factor 2 family protein [Mycobacterium sp.]